MHNTHRVLREVLVGIIGIVVMVVPLAAHGGDKVTLCHRPPGDPGNALTLSVGAAAVPAHLQHGDTLGTCPAACDELGSACTSNDECCSGSCSAGTCVPPCTVDGERCTDGSQCCGGLCSDQGFCASQCTAGGPELYQPPCTFTTPCCPGYGACIQGYCWTDLACSLLTEPCDDLAGVVCCFDYVCSNGACGAAAP